MGSYVGTNINVVLSIIITLITNYGISYYFSDVGTIRVGNTISFDRKLYKPIEIENYKGELINGLKISTPKNINIGKFISSRPVEIKISSGISSSSQQNVVEVSSIPGPGVTRLMISISSEADAKDCCFVVNSKDLKLSITNDSDAVDPIKKALSQAVQMSAIYLFFMLIFNHFINVKINELSKSLAKAKKDSDRLSVEFRASHEGYNRSMDEFREKITEIQKQFKRQRIFLIRRVSDYSKEVEFWRNTLRKLLFNMNCDRKVADELLRVISKSLGTLSTHGNTLREYENFEVLFDVISEIGDEAINK